MRNMYGCDNPENSRYLTIGNHTNNKTSALKA